MENWNVILLNLAQKAMNAGQDVYSFILEQSPELIKEIIFWGVLENGMSAVFSILQIIFFSLVIYFVLRFVKNNKDCFWNDRLGCPEPSITLAFLAFLALPILIICIEVGEVTSYTKQAAKAYFTPRIYVLEYTSALINNKK